MRNGSTSLNTDYCAIDGVLYTLDETELVIYPSFKAKDEFEIPESVEIIGSYAFEDTSLKSLIIPDSVKELGRDIFGSCPEIEALTINIKDPNKLNIDKNVFERFYKKQCKLIVPYGSGTKYTSNSHFQGFLSITEMDNEGVEETGSINVAESELITGMFFENLSEPIRSEGKRFCRYDGKYHCYIVMTSKGFYLKIVSGGYFFLSEHISEYTFGKIWVQNKKEKLTSYDVSYTTDDETSIPFGHFIESVSERTLTYRDLKSGRTFTLNLKTGGKI